MAPRILIFEDAGVEDLKPLTWTRPAWGLRCGIVTLGRKIAAAYGGAEVFYHVRPYLAGAVREERPAGVIAGVSDAQGLPAGPLLAVNGRILAGADLASKIPPDGPQEVFRSGDAVAAVRLADGPRAAEALAGDTLDPAAWPGLPAREVDVPVIRWPWDLVNANAGQIEADFARFAARGEIRGEVHRAAILEGRQNIFIAEGATVEPGAILLAERGPIAIGAGAAVCAGAAIEGPASIGPHSRVRMLARIYAGTTVGPVCKVGGEVGQSILHAFSNKQHDGYLGHSYVGSWCNLGAGTNNSDVKNNYGPVRVAIGGREIDTGGLFAGLFMGDHSTCGINTMFNTGTTVGVGCNVLGGGFPPKDIPSFAWGGAAGLVEHDFDKFCRTAERMMTRRDQQLTPGQRALLEYIFHQTRPRRRAITG